MISVSKKWTNAQLIENIQDKFNFKIDDFDVESVGLNVNKDEGPDCVDDLTELKDNHKLIIEITKKESAVVNVKTPTPKKVTVAAKTSMMSSLSKPKIGGLASKPIVR